MGRLLLVLTLAFYSLGAAQPALAQGKKPGGAGQAPPSGDVPYPSRLNRRSLARVGGSAKTEAAVKAGLDWLLRHQSQNGPWDADGWGDACPADAPCQGPGHDQGDARYDVGLTGLALLAFAGAGESSNRGPRRQQLERALNWLVGLQAADGSLGFEEAHGESIYNHHLATLALAEHYGLSRAKRLRGPLERAVSWLTKAQNPGLGWKYGVRSGRNDTSSTVWAIQALLAAREAGLDVPPSAWEGSTKWLARVTDGQGAVGYETPGGGSAFLIANDGKFEEVPAMTAGAAFCRLRMGQRGERQVAQSLQLLRARPPVKDLRQRNYYYWFLAANAAFQGEGRTWKTWQEALRTVLLPLQTAKGCDRGSWPADAEWCLAGGRVYATAINTLTLETYYRLPRAGKQER